MTSCIEDYHAWAVGQLFEACEEDAEFHKEVAEYDFWLGFEECPCGWTIVLVSPKRKEVQACGQCGMLVEINLDELLDERKI